ncbi:MAG TPA: T9SS type A sorting domain-containing protein [Williamwhitmania sp.]|nr:T9SS type A sorting domain-containing protein [Williamwhitmania sp.]
MLRSTLSIGGSSNTFNVQGKRYFYQQSIGQTSVINSYQAKGYMLRQGFIQPLRGVDKNSAMQSLHVTISPNPFSSIVIVKIAESITDKLNVTLYDMYGRMQYTNRFGATQQLNLDLSFLAQGLYILSVDSGIMHVVTKLTKE